MMQYYINNPAQLEKLIKISRDFYSLLNEPEKKQYMSEFIGRAEMLLRIVEEEIV